MGKRAAIVRTFSRNVVGNACQRVSAQLWGNRRGKCVSGEAGLAGQGGRSCRTHFLGTVRGKCIYY
jgi:hypothetical protein